MLKYEEIYNNIYHKTHNQIKSYAFFNEAYIKSFPCRYLYDLNVRLLTETTYIPTHNKSE